MESLDAIRATFFEECAELLETLEAGLLALQAGRRDGETVDAIFRAVHSIKGGAGAFDLGALVAYAHHFESALDALRAGRIAPRRETVDILLAACDRLGDIVAAARGGRDDMSSEPGQLALLLSGDADAPDRDAATAGEPSTADAAGDAVPWPRWSIAFEPLPGLFESGNEPLHLFRALRVLGEVDVEADIADLPALEGDDILEPCLRWRVLLQPSAPDLTETEIEAVFEFALNLCILGIERLDPQPGGDHAVRHLAPARGPDVQLDPIVPSAQGEPPGASIRVELVRVDRLVDLVGELVICQSMLAQGIARLESDQHGDAAQRLEELQQLTRDMQDGVMAIRAQPVRSLFQRMNRIVREAAQATGKVVALDLDGEATEIDKTVVERLADPLTHLIRNAVDHGIELPGARRAAGKPERGTIRLSARQSSDRVVIEVSDDGQGIDRERVRRHAVKRGMAASDRPLEDAEIDRLMFLPGFSTAERVSSLSGRGVGLDVVQRAIRDLSGTISVASVTGRGCTMSMSLPLTLAILEGMIVRSGEQRVVVPLSAITETQIAEAVEFETLAGDRRVVRHADRVLPYVELGEGLGFTQAASPASENAAIVFLRPESGCAFALGVDGIEMQRQVVIKGLSENFGRVPCVSAATILGDGQVALIVDPAGIASRAGLGQAAGAAA